VGAVLRGLLFFLTGLHTGHVQLRVEVADAEPPLDDRWEECVEVTFEPEGQAGLFDWHGNLVCDLPLDERAYRVRYHASGMAAGDEADTILEDEEPRDAYLLLFWPAAPAPDRIIRQTSAQADYWHRWAQTL
jgi:hypothetical protein